MKRNLSLLYRIVFVIITVYGIYINFNHSGVMKMIVYYTILSNIICLAFFVVIIIADLTHSIIYTDLYYISKLSIIVAILITMIAFEFIIRPYLHSKTGYNAGNLRDNIVHFIVPLMVFLDYLLFDIKGNLKLKYIPYTTIIPSLYGLFVAIYSISGGTFKAFKQTSAYPYIFMDFEKFGNFTFILCGLVLLVFIFLAWLIIMFDKKLISQC